MIFFWKFTYLYIDNWQRKRNDIILFERVGWCHCFHEFPFIYYIPVNRRYRIEWDHGINRNQCDRCIIQRFPPKGKRIKKERALDQRDWPESDGVIGRGLVLARSLHPLSAATPIASRRSVLFCFPSLLDLAPRSWGRPLLPRSGLWSRPRC